MPDNAIVLVVDDTPANLEMITETLSFAGYVVSTATSGERALKRLKTCIPDLILLDVQMPGMDGFETCRQLKADPATREIPIIFMTAFSDTADKVKGLATGAVDYITKPFQQQEVLARIDVHLKLRQANREIIRQKELLEERVHARTAELSAAMQMLLDTQLQLAQYSQTLEQRIEERTADLKNAQARIIAQEKLASLGTLTAGIAHELRNPLNFVKNYAESSIELVQDLLESLAPFTPQLEQQALELTQQLSQDLQGNATAIQHHSDRIEKIITNMMQHARTEQNNLTPQPIDLHALLDRSVKLAYYSKQIQDPNFKMNIHTNYDTTLTFINLIDGDFSRAIINLVDNACDAMRSQQKQIAKTTSSTAYIPTLELSTRHLGGQVEIRIRDNGCGIHPEIKDKIMDPFFTTKPPDEGTGLGLSLTHDIIVSQHCGTFGIESTVSQFTEVIICLNLHNKL